MESMKSFEEGIRSRIDKKTDLSGIHEGYKSENPPFKGDPIFGSYTKKEADEIITEYHKNTGYG